MKHYRVNAATDMASATVSVRGKFGSRHCGRRCIRSLFLIPFLFAGCATSQMNSTPFYEGGSSTYTGNVEDRVNLWPMAYYREPALSVLWPFFSMTDDHLAVRPFYSQFRQTGRSGEYDEFNFLWPFCQFDTAHDRHRLFPVFWSDDSFDVFPIVWWTRDSHFTLFPLYWSAADYDLLLPLYYHDDRRFVTPLFGWNRECSWCFPLYYHDDENLVTPAYAKGHAGGRDYWAVPSLLSWGDASETARSWRFLLGLAGADDGPGDASCQWVFPFFYHDAGTLATPFFGWDAESSWCFPLYYRDWDGLVSLPYVRRTEKDRSYWAVPPLLSWGVASGAETYSAFLLGLGGTASGPGDTFSQWTLPLFYRSETSFMTPLFGYDRTCNGSWVFPCYYKDDETFLSMAYWRKLKRGRGGERTLEHGTFPFWYADDCSFLSPFWISEHDRATGESSWILPPALSWGKANADAREDYILLGLGGRTRDANWVLPLWWQDQCGFMTLLYGQNKLGGAKPGMEYIVPPLLSGCKILKDGSSAYYALLGLGSWATGEGGAFARSWLFPLWYADDDKFVSLPLIHTEDCTSICLLTGVHHGENKSGGWLWPLFGWKSDARLVAAEAMLSAERLDPKVTVAWKGDVRKDGLTNRWTQVVGAVSAHDTTWQLSGLSTGDRYIAWSASGLAENGRIVGTEFWDYGNLLAYKRKGRRTVWFDAKTHERQTEGVTNESGVFCNFLWHSEYENNGTGYEYAEKSLLWRFWHYERRNGDVSVDSFPFFTYDEKKNGYVKTSLIWRLFRYERDPATGTSVDVFFIPVWR